MGRKKTTVYLDEELLTAAKLLAVTSGRRDYEVLEEALREYLLTQRATSGRAQLNDLLDQIAARANIGEDEALELAYSELDVARADRARRSSG